MAIVLATGSAQGTNLTATLTPLIPDLASYVYSRDDPGESVFSDVVGPLDQPSAIRHAVSSIADVFKSSPVSPISGQRVDGLSLLTQVTEVWKVYDNADNSVMPYYLPISAHYVLKLPTDALVTGVVVEALMLRLMGAVCRAAADDYSDQLNTFLHSITRL